MVPIRYCSIDIETTGLDHRFHDILEVGAVLDDLTVQAPLAELPRFHCYVLPHDERGYRGDPFALSMNARILERIAKRNQPAQHPAEVVPEGTLFLHPGEVAHRFAAWARKHWLLTTQAAKDRRAESDPDSPEKAMPGPSLTDIRFVPAGKNVAGFDLPFLRARIPGWEHLRVSHRALDPAMLYFDPTSDKVPPNLAECLIRAGLGDPAHQHSLVAHEAIADALQVVQLLRVRYPVAVPA